MADRRKGPRGYLKISDRSLTARGTRGMIISLPAAVLRDRGLKPGDWAAIYIGTEAHTRKRILVDFGVK